MVDVTIIVCTKNRADALEQCLGSISKAILRCPGRKVEVIVVDNGSVDDGCRITPYYISAEWSSSHRGRYRPRGFMTANCAAVSKNQSGYHGLPLAIRESSGGSFRFLAK
jgi:hypothetical protein